LRFSVVPRSRIRILCASIDQRQSFRLRHSWRQKLPVR